MDVEAARIEHLKLIQDVVTRMGRNSLAIKAGVITISAASAAVSVTSTYVVALGGVPLIIVLWILDAFFLRQERAFRKLYDQVRHGPPSAFGDENYFSMAAEPDGSFWNRARVTFKAMRATSVAILYLSLMGFLILVGVVS